MNNLILGIWGYSADSKGITHDSGAALIKDGVVLAAVNEERLTRKKIEGAYPFASIKMVCDIAGVKPKEIDKIALAGLGPKTRAIKMFKYILKTYSDTGIKLWGRAWYALLTAKKFRRTVPAEFAGIKTVCVEHHTAHAASAYYTCPWPDATVISLDGIGDSATCATVWSGVQGKMTKHWECNGYYSPGIFYSFITNRFGFTPSKHEGKITGLAAYGDPNNTILAMHDILNYDSKRHEFISKDIPKLFKNASYDTWSMPVIEDLMDKFTWEHIAAGVQKITEDKTCELVIDAVKKTGIRNVALSGGVFSNVKVNQRIRELDCVDDVYIHPNMGDGGLGLGAAYYLWATEKLKAKDAPPLPVFLPNVYLGPSYSNEEIEIEIKKSGLPYKKFENVEDEIGRLIANKKIVGRFAGRMEYGPRSLGNRSILAEPKDKTINDWLNKRLKRTEFMPFAPSMIEEDAKTYNIGWEKEQCAARFMTITYDVPKDKSTDIPAVTHVDFTARPQVVRKEDNLSYHKIISAYKKISGIPVVINTSFNMHEEPIVCSPYDAIRSFIHGSCDILALEQFIVYPKE